VQIKDALIKLGFKPTFKLFTDVMVWYDSSLAPRYTRYNSEDPFVIEAQFDVMQAAGIDGVRITYQGLNSPTSEIQTEAARVMALQCEKRGMGCVLLLDPAIAKKAGTTPLETGVISQLMDMQVQEIINSTNYLKDASGKPIIMDFDVQAAGMTVVDATGKSTQTGNYQNVIKALPQYTFGSKHKMYSWMDMPATAANQTAYANDNANPLMLMPGVILEFNDAGFVNPDSTIDNNSEVWTKGTPFREAKSQSGNLYFDQLAKVNKATDYLSLITWNDYRERTTWEQFFAAEAGVRIGS
jgi:hypothetical protein